MLIVVAAVVAVTAGSVYGFWWSAREARIDARQDMAIQARRAASSIGSSLALATRTVEGLAAQPGLVEVIAHPKGCTLASDGVGPFGSVRLDIVGADGRVACSSDPAAIAASSRAHGGSEWLAAALRSRKVIVNWGATDAVAGQPSVVVASPLRKAGVPAGAVVLLLHVPEAGAALVRDYSGPEHASFTLVDRARVVVSSSETRGRASGAEPIPGCAEGR